MPQLAAIRVLLLHRQFLPARLKLFRTFRERRATLFSILRRFGVLTSPIPASLPKGEPRRLAPDHTEPCRSVSLSQTLLRPRLDQELDGYSVASVVAMLHANDLAKELFVGGYFVAERKCDEQAHTHEIVWHAGPEKQPIPCEINHFAYIHDVGKSSVKWAY